jgi:hypothetical protein
MILPLDLNSESTKLPCSTSSLDHANGGFPAIPRERQDQVTTKSRSIAPQIGVDLLTRARLHKADTLVCAGQS